MPSTPFDLSAEVALGADLTALPYTWEWTDATAYVRMRDKIQITAGRSDAYATVNPSTCRLTVDNTGGRWVARNAVGPWYGEIRRGTPIRIRLDAANTVVTDAFGRAVTAGWGSADTGGAYTNSGSGGAVAAADFDVAGGKGQHEVPAAPAYRYSVLGTVSVRDVRQTVTVTCAMPTGGALEPANLLCRWQSSSAYYMARVSITTAGVISCTLASASQTLASATVSGVTHAAATPLNVTAEIVGTAFRMRVWQGATEPTYWHVEGAAEDLTAGAVGIRTGRATGNTNTSAPQAEYDGYSAVEVYPDLFAGYIDELPVRWDPTGNDTFVPLVASGVLRRLEQGQRVYSAVRREWTHEGYAQPIAYWPMEDGSEATHFAAVTPNTLPAVYTDVEPAASTSIAGSDPLPLYGPTGSIGAPVPFYTDAGTWAVRFVMYIPEDLTAEVYPVTWYTTSSTLPAWRVCITSGSPDAIKLQAFNSSSVEQLGHAGLNFEIHEGVAWMIEASATQDGADVDWALRIRSVTTDTTSSGTEAGVTAGRITSFWSLPTTGFDGATFGHLAIYDDTDTSPGWNSLNGWRGETCALRIYAISTENDIPTDVDQNEDTERLGSQPTGSPLDLIREAEAVDGGVLREQNFGLSYMTRAQRYNRDVDLALNQSSGHVAFLSPVDDDLLVRNDWQVQRTDGARARAFDQDHIEAYGHYDDQVDLNLYSDDRPQPFADWRLHLGTAEQIRLPQLAIDLHRNTTLIGDWLRCVVGSRITITNPFDEVGDDLDMHLDSWSLSVNQYEMHVEASCSPAAPWNVFEVEESAQLGLLDTTSSELLCDYAAGDTTMLFASGGSPGPDAAVGLWSTADEPYDVNIAGERVTVTAMTAPAASFVGAGTAAHGDNATVAPNIHASAAKGDLILVFAAIRATSASITTPTGYTSLLTAGNIALFGKIHDGSESAPSIAFTGGASGDTTSAQTATFRGFQLEALSLVEQSNASAQNIAFGVFRPTKANVLALWLGWKQDDWTSAGGLFSGITEIAEFSTTTGNDQACVWNYDIQAAPVEYGTGSWTITGGAAAVSKSAVLAFPGDVQTATVTRAVNGVSKAQSTGVAVSLWSPGVLAL